MKYFVYILKSERNNRHYIGISKDPEKRLIEHNRGESKYTKGYRPWMLIHKEFAGDRKKARQREKELKSSYTKRQHVYSGVAQW